MLKNIQDFLFSRYIRTFSYLRLLDGAKIPRSRCIRERKKK
jgi:hypothetical protein